MTTTASATAATATASATIGFLVLQQEPRITEIVAIALIVTGVAIHHEPAKAGC